MNTPIHDFLGRYADLKAERCHMPGHGGSLGGSDITEIHGAVDIIKESERNAAELFFSGSAGRTLFSCSGGTLAIFAMLQGFARKRIAAFRGVHRSLIDAAVLLGIDIDWVYDIDSLKDCLRSKKRLISAVFVTHIDYYGNTCDIKAISRAISGIFNTAEVLTPPLLVDNAHGAYLVFTDSHPVRLGAAMSADSAHKTLPALTGAAYLHINGDYIKEYARHAESGFALFGTSSPSYLILESLDLCNLHIASEKVKAHTAFEAVEGLKSNLCEIGYRINNSDRLRVTVDANAYGYTGYTYAEQLRKLGVVCEMFDNKHVILMFSTITEKKNTQRVLEAMRDIPQKQAIIGNDIIVHRGGQAVASAREAYLSPKKTVSVHEAVGGVCAGIHVSIPPCVPLLVPGEIVTHEAAELLTATEINEIDIVV